MSDLEQRAHDAIARNPERNWLGFTGAFMSATLEGRHYPTVSTAREHSHIESSDWTAAPVGAVHWWDTQYGQAAIDLDGGGRRVLTASRTVTASWGGGIGTTDVPRLNAAHRYLGWSRTYGSPVA